MSDTPDIAMMRAFADMVPHVSQRAAIAAAQWMLDYARGSVPARARAVLDTLIEMDPSERFKAMVRSGLIDAEGRYQRSKPGGGAP